MAEDIGSLEAEVRSLAGRSPTRCAVCEWIATRDDADEWDRLMGRPIAEIQHRALWKAMVRRGFERGENRVNVHRSERHRVPA